MPNLLFCMTPGVGLNTWKRIGSLNRELRPYVEYIKRGWSVRILTFDKNELPRLPEGIETVRFSDQRMLWFLPWIYKELGKWADVIKTNQSNHAYFYTIAAKIWHKPILLRCGYIQGEYLETTIGLTPKVRFYQWFERKAFRQATRSQVPTEELSAWVQRKYGISEDNISVVPNFVDTALFKPTEDAQKIENSIISVGRLARVKQFDLLIRTCAEISGCTLTIVGEGPERINLENLANELNVNLRLPGNVPNEELPAILNQHRIFAITSLREGHPKALIEAMACGMACIGVNSVGIQNVIEHGVNGLLVEAGIRDLVNNISSLMNDKPLSKAIGKKAQEFARKKFSFDNCFAAEFGALSKSMKKAV